MAGLSCPTRDSRGDCTPGPKMEIVSAPPDFFPGSYKSLGLSLGEMLAPTVPRMKGKGQRAKVRTRPTGMKAPTCFLLMLKDKL